MSSGQQVYRLKVDTSGASSFQPKLASANTSPAAIPWSLFNDATGLHIKTLDQLLAEVQAEFAKHVPVRSRNSKLLILEAVLR
jgi:hypothetical protein